MPLLLALLFVTAALAADPIVAGKYTGKWEGAAGAAGDFLLTLARKGDAWNAEVAFQIGSERVQCTVTSLRVDGSKLHVVYTFDLLGMKLESTIDGERAGNKLSGKYRTRSPADNSQVDYGSWEAAAT